MTNTFEQKAAASPETQRNFKNSLIDHILGLSVAKIVANTKGRDVNERDLAKVMGEAMKQYKNSDMTRKMLGIDNYEKWDVFFDEVVSIVSGKVREEKKKETPLDSPTLKSENLKQKKLF